MPTDREVELARRVAELEAENHRLRSNLDTVKTERKQLRDDLYGPVEATSEEELIKYVNERMRDFDPEPGRRFIQEIEARVRGQA